MQPEILKIMNLNFTTHINNTPTFFVEKITKALSETIPDDLNEFIPANTAALNYKSEMLYIDKVLAVPAKKHTIRVDASKHWKAGNNIHFLIHNRTPQRFQFAPVIPCVSVQTIEITWIDTDGFKLPIPTVFIDGNWIVYHDLKQLAVNDGFDSIDAFFEYFNTDFKGHLIHWTSLKY